MKTKICAEYALERANEWLAYRKEILDEKYEKAIQNQMRRKWYTLFRKSDRETAIKRLDRLFSEPHNCYYNKLAYRGSYWISIVLDAKKMAEVALKTHSIKNEKPTITIDEGDLFWL